MGALHAVAFFDVEIALRGRLACILVHDTRFVNADLRPRGSAIVVEAGELTVRERVWKHVGIKANGARLAEVIDEILAVGVFHFTSTNLPQTYTAHVAGMQVYSQDQLPPMTAVCVVWDLRIRRRIYDEPFNWQNLLCKGEVATVCSNVVNVEVGGKVSAALTISDASRIFGAFSSKVSSPPIHFQQSLGPLYTQTCS